MQSIIGNINLPGKVVNGHTEAFMNFASCDGHCCNLPIFRIDISKEAGNNVGVNMWCLQVIYVPEYGALLVVNNIVYDTPVVLISLIAHFL